VPKVIVGSGVGAGSAAAALAGASCASAGVAMASASALAPAAKILMVMGDPLLSPRTQVHPNCSGPETRMLARSNPFVDIEDRLVENSL
jgi:hypothetical protein